MPLVNLPLTAAQARRLYNGQRVRMTGKRVGEEGTVPIIVSNQMARKIERRMIAGRGFDFTNEQNSQTSTPFDNDLLSTSGSGIKKTFRKLGKVTKRVIKSIRKEAPGVLKQVGRETGRVAQQAKKYVPKSVVKGAIAGLATAATTAIGQPYLASTVRKVLNPGVDALYETNLARGSVGKNFGKSYGKNLVEQGLGF